MADLEFPANRFDASDLRNVVEVARRQPLLVRHLSHIRQRLQDQRLAFVVGAGISAQAGVPLWRELIARLKRHYGRENIPNSYGDPKYSATLIAQFIFNRFRVEEQEKARQITYDLSPRLIPVVVRDAWYRHIFEALYVDVPPLHEVKAQHPYLAELGEMVFRSPFCLSLNFDDILDRIAQENASASLSRKPNVIWRPQPVDRPQSCAIYHINGYLPQKKGASRSESIVLTEDSFAALLASPRIVDTEYVMNRLVANTILIIGASFEDQSLRNLFYAAARRNPAGFHYNFDHDKAVNRDNIDDPERKDKYDLNREMYNVVTYYVREEEISSLIRFLSLPTQMFKQRLNELASDTGTPCSSFRYYVIGSVSSGKSSVIERLRGFGTYEEWSEQPPEAMYKDAEDLTDDEDAQVLEWVLTEVALKSEAFRAADFGIHVMDRAPLDLFAFSRTTDENKSKATRLKKKLGAIGVQQGHLIFLEAEEKVLFERQVRRGRGPGWLSDKSYKGSSLTKQADKLRKIYSISAEAAFDTSELSIADVAREVAEKILFADYQPADLESTRKRFEDGEELP